MTFLKISVVLIIQFAIVLVTIGQTPKIEFRFSCKEELNAIGLDYAEMMLINHSDDRIGIGKDVNFCLEAQIASGQWLIFYEANVIPYPPSFYYIQKRDTLFKKIQINIHPKHKKPHIQQQHLKKKQKNPISQTPKPTPP